MSPVTSGTGGHCIISEWNVVAIQFVFHIVPEFRSDNNQTLLQLQ
jgi:hypothetical protein